MAKKLENEPGEARASDDDDPHHVTDLGPVTKEIFEALGRLLPQLNPLDYSAICSSYQFDEALEGAPEVLTANSQALAATCAEARRTLTWLLERDLDHKLKSADGNRIQHLQLALEIVRGHVLLDLGEVAIQETTALVMAEEIVD